VTTLAAIDWWWGGDLLGRGLSILDLAMRLIMAVFVVMRRRPVPITLAWLVLVTAVPFVGVILYALVGESRLGAKRLREAEKIVREIEPVVVARWHEGGITFQADRVTTLGAAEARARRAWSTCLGPSTNTLRAQKTGTGLTRKSAASHRQP